VRRAEGENIPGANALFRQADAGQVFTENAGRGEAIGLRGIMPTPEIIVLARILHERTVGVGIIFTDAVFRA